MFLPFEPVMLLLGIDPKEIITDEEKNNFVALDIKYNKNNTTEPSPTTGTAGGGTGKQ